MKDSLGRFVDRRPEALVPTGYEERPLPPSVRQHVDRTAERLAEALHFAFDVADSDIDYEVEMERCLGSRPWKWYGDGSERTVACLGRTYKGQPIYDDLTGVVVKFTPGLRAPGEASSTTVRTPGESGNLSELAVWKHACEYGNREWFASILDYSEAGDWIAMKQVLPVYKHSTPTFANNPVDHLSTRHVSDIPSQVAETLPNVGYDPHVKDGNVGIDPDTGAPVVVDFGAHCPVVGWDTEDLIRFVLED